MRHLVLIPLLLAAVRLTAAETPVFRQTVSPAPEAAREALRRARIFQGPDGKIWIHGSGTILVNPGAGSRLVAGGYLRQVIGTPDGAVIATNDTAWGALLPSRSEPGKIEFRPVAPLPLEECRVAVSTTGEILFFGRRSPGGYSLILFDPTVSPAADCAPLIHCETPVSAAAADKTHAYAATGATILRAPMPGGEGKPESWRRAPASIVDLAADGQGGLFVATTSHVLHVEAEGNTTTLLETKNPRLTFTGGALHILREDLSVISLEWPATPRAKAKTE